MKKIWQKKWPVKILGLLAVLGIGFGMTTPVLATSGLSTFAASCSGGSFLGFVPWYDGLECDNNGAISSSNFSGGADEIASGVWKIILNVVSDISLAVGYIALVLVIYSGFVILTSQGDANKMAQGRKMLTATAVGAAIAILAAMLVRLVIGVIT